MGWPVKRPRLVANAWRGDLSWKRGRPVGVEIGLLDMHQTGFAAVAAAHSRSLGCQIIWRDGAAATALPRVDHDAPKELELPLFDPIPSGSRRRTAPIGTDLSAAPTSP